MPRSLFHRRAPAYGMRAAGEREAEILIYDEIGFFGITAADFARDLKALQVDLIRARINSPGGDLFQGVAIYNLLRDHPAKVITHIDGIAASIASVIALAGDEVHIARNGMLMIHEAHGLAFGTANDLRATADRIEKVNDATVLRAYLDRLGEAREEDLREWMTAETWFDADEAVDEGFADAVEEREAVAARFDLSVFTRVPSRLAAMAKPAKREAEQALRDAGFSRQEARAMLAHRPSTQCDAGNPASPEDHTAVARSFREAATLLRGGTP